MTDPALDGPDAEAAILTAIYGIGCEDPSADAETLLHALNEQGVVLCDDHALTELRQQAKAGEALAADLRAADRPYQPLARHDLLAILARHGYEDPR